MFIIMALASSEQACVIKWAQTCITNTQSACVLRLRYMATVITTTTHTLQTCAPLLDSMSSMSRTMNINFIFMILHITLCILVVPTLCSVEPTACAKAILEIL